MVRIAKPSQTLMTKVCTWLPVTDYEAIIKIKGDISASLWIRRAIKNALSKGEDSTHTPQTAYATESVDTTATTLQGSKTLEVEAT
ncbi:MAG TPA: hypothetical protein VE544_05045 [Nitrososphaeraceae archaeon]|jgi:hypothetical protein|nr:hypothetical protein [Nitrososphaeraceae archaeon]